MRHLLLLPILFSAVLACRSASPSSGSDSGPAIRKGVKLVAADVTPLSADAKPEASIAERTVLADVRLGDPLSVRLHGQGPFRFGFDTGQSVAVLLSPDLAGRLALPVVDKIHASDGTSSLPVDVVRIDSVEVGGVDLGGQTSIVLQPGTDVDGAIGFPLFSGLLVELDYAGGRLRVLRGELPEPDGRKVLALTNLQGIPMVPIAIGGETLQAVLDSGSEADLLVPMSMVAKLPLESPPVKSGRMSTLFGEFDLYTARLKGRVTLGGIELVDPELTFSDHFREVNVGGHFLARFRVTFDPARKRVQFEA
jgi:aspartyl protease